MKRICMGLLLPALLVCVSCSTFHYDNDISQLDKIGSITVQCRNESTIQSMVEQILKLERVSEWRRDKPSSYELEIEAKYSDITNPRLREMEQRLNALAGVWSVEVRRDRIPPRGPF